MLAGARVLLTQVINDLHVPVLFDVQPHIFVLQRSLYPTGTWLAALAGIGPSVQLLAYLHEAAISPGARGLLVYVLSHRGGGPIDLKSRGFLHSVADLDLPVAERSLSGTRLLSASPLIREGRVAVGLSVHFECPQLGVHVQAHILLVAGHFDVRHCRCENLEMLFRAIVPSYLAY